MKKTSFVKQINSVLKKAIETIDEAAIRKGKIVLFIGDPEDEENEDAFLQLPTITSVSKHGFYEQFAVVSVERKKKDTVLNCVGRGENNGRETFILKEISSDDAVSLCYLADMITAILK